MGPVRVLRTYGHHRKRCVVIADSPNIFDLPGHFSTSSSESGIGPSDSPNSEISSHSSRRRKAKTKALSSIRAHAEENYEFNINKRKRQPRGKENVCLSEKNSGTNSNDDIFSPVTKRVTRRALQNLELQKDLQKNTVCKSQTSKVFSLCDEASKLSAYNFSEFDEYSLIISQSHSDADIQTSSHQIESAIGTSTPYLSGKAVSKISPCLKSNISVISPLCDSEDGFLSRSSVSRCSTFFNSCHKKKLCLSSDEETCSSPYQQHDMKRDYINKEDDENFQRLQESFVSLRVGHRRTQHTSKPITEPLACLSESQDNVLFGSLSSEKEGKLAQLCKAQVESLKDNCETGMHGSCSPVDDKLVQECKIHLQTLRTSLLSKNRILIEDLLMQDRMENSHSLFDTADQSTPQTPDIDEVSDSCSDDSRAQGSGDLSDIVEDAENDADLENVVSNEEEFNDDQIETSQSIAYDSDSLNDGSPVRYMLTKSSDSSIMTSFVEKCNESSILGVQQTPKTPNRNNLSHSLIVLTPCTNMKRQATCSPRTRVFELCNQDTFLPFSSIISDNVMQNCVKIGEGVYGEVFRSVQEGASVAFKIIPIEGDCEVNDECQKTFAEILPEIVISKELSQLRELTVNSCSNFCPVNRVSCVQGCYPTELLEQWDIYNSKKTSENDRPDMFGKDQLYILFEFGDGGCDLESCKLKSAAQGISVLQQVAYALAVAEEELEFEHRDLHVGNVLVHPTTMSTITITLNDVPFAVETHGVKATIIDFTLSRLSRDGCTVFCDLASDQSLFTGKGDYQFEIYRLMKNENDNNWEVFNPHTNILWLHYLCDKLSNPKRYSISDKANREGLRRLRLAMRSLLQYSSAKHFVVEDDFFHT